MKHTFHQTESFHYRTAKHYPFNDCFGCVEGEWIDFLNFFFYYFIV